jgi:lipoate-protein ligase A
MLLEKLQAAACLDRERELHHGAEESGREFVYTWEAEEHAVVLGASGTRDEVIDDVPVLRRDSGGGAVVIGPGCLNYAVILDLERRSALRDVSASYGAILTRVARATGVAAHVDGTDLTFDGRKFGGCSQRRLRRALLHHGTLLYDFDLQLITRHLREPARRPAHRGSRTHAEFLTNASLRSDFAERLAHEFPEAEMVA